MKNYTMNNEKKAIRELGLDQLDGVTGGTIMEIAYDSEFLKDMGVLDESFSSFEVIFNYNHCAGKVFQAWNKLDFYFLPLIEDYNKYGYNSKEITRKEALQIAAKNCGKTIDIDDYWIFGY